MKRVPVHLPRGAVRRHLGGREGFSLVELVLTVMIVGIVAAMAVPRYVGAMNRYHVDAAARRVVADIDHARSQATARSRSRRMEFRVSGGQIWMLEMGTLEDPTDKYKTKLKDEPYASEMESADFGGDHYLVFDGYGKPDSGGSVVVRRGELVRTISVDADTGRAEIQ